MFFLCIILPCHFWKSKMRFHRLHTSHHYLEWHLSVWEMGWCCQTVNLLEEAEKSCKAADSLLWADSAYISSVYWCVISVSSFFNLTHSVYRTQNKAYIQIEVPTNQKAYRALNLLPILPYLFAGMIRLLQGISNHVLMHTCGHTQKS